MNTLIAGVERRPMNLVIERLLVGKPEKEQLAELTVLVTDAAQTRGDADAQVYLEYWLHAFRAMGSSRIVLDSDVQRCTERAQWKLRELGELHDKLRISPWAKHNSNSVWGCTHLLVAETISVMLTLPPDDTWVRKAWERIVSLEFGEFSSAVASSLEKTLRTGCEKISPQLAVVMLKGLGSKEQNLRGDQIWLNMRRFFLACIHRQQPADHLVGFGTIMGAVLGTSPSALAVLVEEATAIGKLSRDGDLLQSNLRQNRKRLLDVQIGCLSGNRLSLIAGLDHPEFSIMHSPTVKRVLWRKENLELIQRIIDEWRTVTGSKAVIRATLHDRMKDGGDIFERKYGPPAEA